MSALPSTSRLSGGWTKRILREALRGILPDRIRTRRSKLGFLTPESAWLAGPLSGWLRETLSSPRYLAEVVDLRGVKRLLSRRAAGDRSHPLEDILFYLAIYESWARLFLGPHLSEPVGNEQNHIEHCFTSIHEQELSSEGRVRN
jgi:asparagine synthase (glutamine-hydrolysing)